MQSLEWTVERNEEDDWVLPWLATNGQNAKRFASRQEADAWVKGHANISKVRALDCVSTARLKADGRISVRLRRHPLPAEEELLTRYRVVRPHKVRKPDQPYVARNHKPFPKGKGLMDKCRKLFDGYTGDRSGFQKLCQDEGIPKEVARVYSYRLWREAGLLPLARSDMRSRGGVATVPKDFIQPMTGTKAREAYDVIAALYKIRREIPALDYVCLQIPGTSTDTIKQALKMFRANLKKE